MKTIRMPKELLEKWLAALRSGEYRQARDLMSDGRGGYCCLGVLQRCESGRVFKAPDDELPSPTWLKKKGVTFTDGDGDEALFPYLPKLRTAAPVANDCGDFDFPQIADAIEACAEGY